MRRSLFALAATAALALPAFAQQAASSSIIDKFAVLVPERVIEQSEHCRKLFSGLKVEAES